MKKLWLIVALVLVFTAAVSPLCLAADNFDTLVSWDIRIAVPDGKTAVLRGSEYYIYAQKTGYIPYVMLTVYRYDSEETFIADFTEYMQKQHPDLTVTAEAEERSMGDKDGWEIDYTYSVSGSEVLDRRFVINANGHTYVFCSKEVKARGMTVGSMLEDVVSGCEFFSVSGTPAPTAAPEPEDEDEDEDEDEESLAGAYLYCLENGMPKYWLDLTGALSDGPVLHCYFRSGESTFSETVYIPDTETADVSEHRILFRNVYTADGEDVSHFFRSFAVYERGDELVLSVYRDPKTLSGGEEDNLLTGRYEMEPLGADNVYEYFTADGVRKYWLTMNGEEDLILHAMFRSGDPTWYEETFTLDLTTARTRGDAITIRKVYNRYGDDISRAFRSLVLRQDGNAIVMEVERDESTLAGGADDNILTGSYPLFPRAFLCPGNEGPYAPEELARWAQIRYFTETGFYPPEAEAETNPDGTVTIHLYEVVELDGLTHTATSAWYTVDEYGVGQNDITEEAVSLMGK